MNIPRASQPCVSTTDCWKGIGSHQKRVDIIAKQLTGNQNVFKNILAHTTVAFEERVNQWAFEANTRLGKLFDEVVTDFHSRFDNDEVEDGSKKAFRERLLQAVEEAQEAIKGPLKAEIEEVKKYD